MSFHYRLFPRKINEKFFQKILKTLFWGRFGPLYRKSGQKWIFLEKRALSVFKYSNYLPPGQKSVKTDEPFLRKTLNRRTDWQTYNVDFIGSSVGQGSKTLTSMSKCISFHRRDPLLSLSDMCINSNLNPSKKFRKQHQKHKD